MKKIALLVLLIFGAFGAKVYAQEMALKTNLLYDVTTTINLGYEVALGKKTTLDIWANYNPWTLGYKWVGIADSPERSAEKRDSRLKHWMVQPELRWWLCEKFNGHFFGVHIHGGQFNVGAMSLPFNIGRYKDGKEYLGQFPTNLEVPDTKGSTVKGVQYERGNTYLNNPKDPTSNYYKPLADYLAKNPPANLSGGQAQAIEDWAIAQARSENVYANADRDGIYSNGFEGWFVGAGVSYGYHWIIAPRFSMEFTLGIGYAFLDYKKTRCTDCRTVIGEEVKHYFGPTRAGISLVWMLK